MQKKYQSIIWSILLCFFVFHGVLEDTVPVLYFFDESIGLLCIPLAVYDYWKSRKDGRSVLSGSRRWECILLLLFLTTGLIGNVLYRFQPAWIVAVSAVLSTKFFMILLTAGFLQKYIPIDLQEQELTIQILSILWFAYYGLTLIFKDYLVAPEAWDICAKSSLLFALLIFCKHQRVWLYRVCMLLMILMLA